MEQSAENLSPKYQGLCILQVKAVINECLQSKWYKGILKQTNNKAAQTPKDLKLMKML